MSGMADLQREPGNAPHGKSRGKQDTCGPSSGPSRSAGDLPADQLSHESSRAPTAGLAAPNPGAPLNVAPPAAEASDGGRNRGLGPEFWQAYAEKIGLPKAGETIEVSPLAQRLGVGIQAGSVRRAAGEVSRSTRAAGRESRSLAAPLGPGGGEGPASLIATRRGNRRERATAARASARRACAAGALLVALIILLALGWPSHLLRLPVPTAPPTVPSAIERSQQSAADRSILLGIVATSALGLLLMAGLALTYGVPPLRYVDDGSEPGSTRRRVVTRLGYAGVGFCFALTTMLAVVLAYQSRALSVPTRPVPEMHAIDERVGGTAAGVAVAGTGASGQQANSGRRLADVEQRQHGTATRKLGHVTRPLRRQDTVVNGGRASASTSPSAVTPRPPAPSASAPKDPMSSPETVASSGAAPAPNAPTESSHTTKPSLAEQTRDDSKQVKREASSPADEIENRVHRLRDRVARKPPRDERGREVVAGPTVVPHSTDR
jgi:hypothetical protein